MTTPERENLDKAALKCQAQLDQVSAEVADRLGAMSRETRAAFFCSMAEVTFAGPAALRAAVAAMSDAEFDLLMVAAGAGMSQGMLAFSDRSIAKAEGDAQ